jgi:hypothetical protein
MKRHEEQIVRVLADSVRVMTMAQIAGIWWTDTRWGRSRATAAINQLATEGWLHVQRALSRPVEAFASPLIGWCPGKRRPDFGVVARSLHRRAMADAKPVKVVFAATRAVTFFGSGRAPTVKLTQMTHDLNVSELYLHYRRSGLPDRCWTSEDRLPRDWPLKERPDALLRNDAGDFVRAVEYGGDYQTRRLSELHAGLSSIGLGYEIW